MSTPVDLDLDNDVASPMLRVNMSRRRYLLV
jgi:hypothetical protein